MGWQDAPVVGASQQKPKWQTAPEVAGGTRAQAGPADLSALDQPGAGAPVKPPPPLDAGGGSTMGFITGNLNKGIAGLAGLPVDTIRNVMNIGIAGYGSVMGPSNQRPMQYDQRLTPELIEPGIGSGQWFEQLLRRGNMVTPASDPTSGGGRYAAAALQAIPGMAVGRPSMQQAPRAAGAQATSGALGEGAADVAGEEYRGVGTMMQAPRRLATPPSAGDRARTERQADRFETARDMGIPIPPRDLRPHQARDRMEDATTKGLRLPEGTELSPQTLNAYIKQHYADGYEKLINEPTLKSGLQPNAAFQAELQRLGQDVSAGSQSLPTTFKSNKEAIKLLGDYGFGALPGNAKATIPPRSQPISAKDAVSAIRTLREDAATNFQSDKPQQHQLAKVQKGIANALEQLIEDSVAASGNKQLVQNFRDARQNIAKAHDVLETLDPATGKMGMQRTAKVQADRPVSGPLKDASDVAREFPGAMRGPQNEELFTHRATPMSMMHPQATAAHWATRMWDPITTSAPVQHFAVDPRSRLSPEQLQLLRMLTAATASNRREIPPPP